MDNLRSLTILEVIRIGTVGTLSFHKSDLKATEPNLNKYLAVRADLSGPSLFSFLLARSGAIWKA